MQPFSTLDGLVLPLDRANVDTDQIIPQRFLRKIARTGFGPDLFANLRYQGDSMTPNPDFVLNFPRYRGAEILLARANFGCGSSREHAPWALLDYGFRCLIAPSFADIFFNNCLQNGILAVVLPEQTVGALFAETEATPGYTLHVSLPEQVVVTPSGMRHPFEIDAFQKHCLLSGLDSIGLTLQFEQEIAAYEAGHPTYEPVAAH
ncbi:MAG TPA: 3-isopropylmalate dehydratase small subunit [Chloroflexota bacterium]|jgi:3-isopropylmalate/(R)-2-methylmalate dehydratase small subunit|nr:3-isopropylmalate dehydratase small subunit [Chloroflexota bacterium]